jgi:hypothetical protein
MTLSVLAALALALAAPPPPRTMRVDYIHLGDASGERFGLDRVVLEPLPWPGNPDRPLDDTGFGKYQVEVRDLATSRLLYSRGFASVYGEWETTEEARRLSRAFQESVRFPAPEAPVQVALRKRDPAGGFREVWSFRLDPRDRAISSAQPPSPGPVLELARSGDPARKLDLLLVGDGYTAAERGKFEKDARRLLAVLFDKEPYRSRRGDFNVWGIVPPAAQTGISRPLTGQHRWSRVGASYDAFGSERYVLAFEERSLREVASFAPYDALAILVNGATYGGGGIYGLYTTVAADSLWAPYIFVHELGHSLGGLGDEYFTSDSPLLPAGETRPEPWEPNVTADPRAAKWAALLTPGLALPSPWPKEEFTKRSREIQAERRRIRAENRPEAEMDALFLAEKKEETALLGGAPLAGKVGAFEGANYEATGYYRPQVDCVMFSRNDVPFCPVCQRAIGRVIDLHTGPGR